MTRPLPKLLTARDVASAIGVSPETVLRWHRAGRLRGHRLASGVLRFREDEIVAWIEGSAPPPVGVVALLQPARDEPEAAR